MQALPFFIPAPTVASSSEYYDRVLIRVATTGTAANTSTTGYKQEKNTTARRGGIATQAPHSSTGYNNPGTTTNQGV